MKIVFCAGADRTGKSTLCRKFIENGYEYVHFNPPKGSPFEEYYGFLKNVLENPENSNKNFIIDRYMYCEFPYSKHYRRDSDMTVGKMHDIETGILKLDPDAVIVYCETGLDSNWKRICAEGKNEFKSKEELEKLRCVYHEILGKSRLEVMTYNFEKGYTPEDVYKAVSE